MTIAYDDAANRLPPNLAPAADTYKRPSSLTGHTEELAATTADKSGADRRALSDYEAVARWLSGLSDPIRAAILALAGASGPLPAELIRQVEALRRDLR